MLEWIGICCCSSFVSCICSLIATTFCLSPNGVCLRKNMTPNDVRNEKPKQLTISKIAGHTLESKTKKLKRKRSPISRSRSSCKCVNFEKFSEIRYGSNFDDDNYPTSFSPRINSPQNKTAIFIPCSKICKSNFTQASEIAGDLDSKNEIELRKRIDEYDAIFKKFKELIEEKNKRKKISEIVIEKGVSNQNSLNIINTSRSNESIKMPVSKKSNSLIKFLNPQLVANSCEISDSEGKLINKISEKSRSVILYENYNNDTDYEKREKDFRQISPMTQYIDFNNTKSSSTRGWQYRMKKSMKKVCERMIRGDDEKSCEFKSEYQKID